ncbi:MAG: helix-turn-helix transcriptional regulator [Segetibacter sp.]
MTKQFTASRWGILTDSYFGKYPHRGLPSVRFISESLNVAVSYISQVLKLLTGQSTQEHIQDKLIEKVNEKLSTTDLSISEIAYELGFEHSQSFIRLLKIKTNLSPLQFRQSLTDRTKHVCKRCQSG